MTNFKLGSVSLILAHYVNLVCNFLTLEHPFSLPYLETLDSNSVLSSKDVALLWAPTLGKKGLRVFEEDQRVSACRVLATIPLPP